MNDEGRPMRVRDLVQTSAVGIVSAAIGAAATIYASTTDYLSETQEQDVRDRSNDIEMVRIALSILSGENKETSINGRRFALRVLSKYSEVAIPMNEFEVWAATGTLPEPDSLWLQTTTEGYTTFPEFIHRLHSERLSGSGSSRSSGGDSSGGAGSGQSSADEQASE